MVDPKLEARTQLAELIANKALDLALKALSKVEAMEKSTHKAYFVSPTTNPNELVPPAPFEMAGPHPSSKELEESLDRLFNESRSRLDDSSDVFLEGE